MLRPAISSGLRLLGFVCASAVAATWAAPCEAAAPSLGSITPAGAQRGTEVEVVFRGERLDDAQEIFVYYPGIEVIDIEVVDDKQVKTRLKIADDCRLGIHAMRVRAASGISNLDTFMVGALPEIEEIEPNSDFNNPQKIDLDVTVNGVITNEDVDYFLVEAKQGERITAEVEGIRLGKTFFDPYVAIMDKRRFELDAADDSALVYQDGVASIIAPEDGEYLIQIRESSFGGNGNCRYRLHVGRFPRPTAAVPSGGRPGETVEVRWLGDVQGEWTEHIVVPTSADEMHDLFAQDEHGIAPSPNVFRVGDLPNVVEIEPNDTIEQAIAVEVPAALNGVIGQPGDVDCYKFSATKGQVYDVRVHARSLRSPLDSVLTIVRQNGAGVASNDDSGSPDSYVRFTAPEDDQYVIMVHDHLRTGGADYAYRVEVTPVEPKLVMGLPELQQFVDITAPVPRGNRNALLVSAARSDFGGELIVNVADMPAGVAMETVNMAADQTTVPVLLTAEAGAELAGALADVIGRHADESTNIAGRLVQTTSMVRGQNNIRVWDHQTDRMAMAVIQEVPFSIEIVQPRVPLVRGGNMDLKIVAHREEGFTAPIAVRMLYNPPGVGSSGSISIAEGESEAVIPINANGNATLGTWKIVVLGTATVGNGPVQVSTQLANLEVSEPFFNIEFHAAAVEKGQATSVALTVAQNKEFAGEAKVELLGLPNEVTAEPLSFDAEAENATFQVKTTENSPVGKHTTLTARAIVTLHDEPIIHMFGGGELRIDEPLPPKKDEPEKKPEAKPADEPPKEKPLSRLEQLRLERQQAKETAAAAATSAADKPSPDDESKPEEKESDDAEADESKADETKAESDESKSES